MDVYGTPFFQIYLLISSHSLCLSLKALACSRFLVVATESREQAIKPFTSAHGATKTILNYRMCNLDFDVLYVTRTFLSVSLERSRKRILFLLIAVCFPFKEVC